MKYINELTANAVEIEFFKIPAKNGWNKVTDSLTRIIPNAMLGFTNGYDPRRL